MLNVPVIRVKRSSLQPSRLPAAPPERDGVHVEFAGRAAFPRDTVLVHHSGIQLKTRWFLDTGTEVELGLQSNGQRLDVQGLVVACHPCRNAVSYYETTVFFPSLTQAQQRKLAALAASIA